jgi:inosine-uridine nucleoside N-ribohydrolase
MQIHEPDACIPVILDTDLGSDIDDTWALAMLLGLPQIDLKLVVTSFQNSPAKTCLVAKILQETGHTYVPVGTGIQTSEDPLTQETWLGDFDLAQSPGVIHPDGIQALIDTIHASMEPITLLVIGPSTNIGEILRRDPCIAKNARVVAMAGSLYRGHAGC